MKKLFVLAMLLAVIPAAYASHVDRDTPQAVQPGEQFNITYRAYGLSGKVAVVVQDTVRGGCTFPGGGANFETILLEVGKTELTTELLAPDKGNCTFSGSYLFGTEMESKAIQDDIVYIGKKPNCVSKTCGRLRYQCGTWDDGCGVSIDCGQCSQGKSCEAGRCVTPKPIQHQKRYEKGTFAIFGMVMKDMKVRVYEKFSFIGNRLSGTMSMRTDSDVQCQLNRFRPIQGGLTADDWVVNGTAELICRIPVHVKITENSIIGTYNKTKVFELSQMS